MINDRTALEEVCRAAKNAGAVGIDTEFIWNRSFYPSLGVVQVGYPDGEAVLIDAPEIKDWAPFGELMHDAGVIKILHDAQQDLTILQRVCGAYPRNIFDTQRSAGFIGKQSTISLREILKQLLKVRLDKTETQSDWLARPLTEAQVRYAEDDVRNSVLLMNRILEKADALGRREWIADEMRYYEQESLYQESDPDAIMPRVRGSGALTHQQRNILRSLASWRETTARKRNLPRAFILSDDALVVLSKKTPATKDALRPIRGLSEKALHHNREMIWEAIERGIAGDLPEINVQSSAPRSADEGYEARVDFALAYLKGTCIRASVDPALVANRSEVTALVLDTIEPDLKTHRILNGWRADFCGKVLLDLLQGQGSLKIDPKLNLPTQA
ncbi:MAG: Ribonuclease D [Opitutia bacterium UBA7350]|nr:MAG: Ribonuclease D [Opitutae bacterium UBA7350]